MKRYWFALMDAEYDDLGVTIPDGSSKQTAEKLVLSLKRKVFYSSRPCVPAYRP